METGRKHYMLLDAQCISDLAEFLSRARSKQLLGTSASLVVTSALLVVTRSYWDASVCRALKAASGCSSLETWRVLLRTLGMQHVLNVNM